MTAVFAYHQQDPRAYDAYNSTLTYQDAHNAPQLVSELTKEQYLDTISCPRIDPIHQGRKIMINSKDAETFSSDDEVDNDGSHADEDVMDQTDERHDAIRFLTGNEQKGGLAIQPNGRLSYHAAEKGYQRFARSKRIWTAVEKGSVSGRLSSEPGRPTLRRSRDDSRWIKQQQYGTAVYAKNARSYSTFIQPALQHQIVPNDKEKASSALIGNRDKDGYALEDSGKVVYYRDGIAYHRVPHHRPVDRLTSIIIEETCRLICSQQPMDRSDFQSYCVRQKGQTPGYGFLNTGDVLHRWFQWRLEENEAGRGFEGSLQELGLWSCPVP